ncbi:MAG: exodeoxyribonuclease small subunit [Bacteroidetes bacterium]|jgi:exodeoxyribonuclease VII small subunit|nr:exodeoxyribonuclease small subunit [Bacteroidota bacterium]
MGTKKAHKGSFESSLKRLEVIVESLEQGKVSLDEAVGLYEEGIQLSRECGEKLKATELKIRKLAKSVGGDFEVTDLDQE